jgi:hypothetical protein
MLPRPNFSRGCFHARPSPPVNGLAFLYRVNSFLLLLMVTYNTISALRHLFDKGGYCIWQEWFLSIFFRAISSLSSPVAARPEVLTGQYSPSTQEELLT